MAKNTTDVPAIRYSESSEMIPNTRALI